MSFKVVNDLIYRGFKALSRRLRDTPLRRIRLVTHLQDRMFQKLHSSGPVCLLGATFHTDARDRIARKRLALYGGGEEYELHVLLKRLPVGGTFVDVGANFGLYTVLASRQVGIQGQVMAFEPDPDNAMLLRRNIGENACGNVRVVQGALSSGRGVARLYEDPVHRGMLSLANVRGNHEWIDVTTMTLDESLEESGVRSIDVIKIDVEGAELPVLEGAKRTLESTSGLEIFMEVNAPFMKRFGYDPLDPLHLLVGLGYRLYHIDESCGQLKALSPSSGARLAREHYKEINVFCTRRHA